MSMEKFYMVCRLKKFVNGLYSFWIVFMILTSQHNFMWVHKMPTLYLMGEVFFQRSKSDNVVNMLIPKIKLASAKL